MKNSISEKTDVLFPDRREGLNYLEQLTALAGKCLKFNTPFLAQENPKLKKIQLIKTSCNMWDCPQCSSRLANKWIARIIDGMNNLPPEQWYLFTLTSHANMRGKLSLINLRSNWHKVRKRLARVAKKQDTAMYYARNYEQHKDSSFHMHFVCNVTVSKKWLKDNAAECGMGHQAHVGKEVNAGQAAGYMAKYMVKMNAMELLKYPKNARRFDVSRNWVAWNEYETEDLFYYVGDLAAAKALSAFRKYQGYTVFDLSIRNLEKEMKKEMKK